VIFSIARAFLIFVWQEDDATRLVWITMLAMADRHGYVGASVPGLAARARVPVPAVRAALEKFLAPDPDSRSKEFEGRRIEVSDRGWTLLNYARFRDMRDEEAKREHDRERQRKHRSVTVGHAGHASSQTIAQAEADPQAQAEVQAEVQAEKKERNKPILFACSSRRSLLRWCD